MEIDVVSASAPSIPEHDNESDEESDKNKSGSVELSVWRTSKAHRYIALLLLRMQVKFYI